MISARFLNGIYLEILKESLLCNNTVYFVEMKDEQEIREFMIDSGEDLKTSGYELTIVRPNAELGRGHDNYGINIAWGR